MKKAIVLLLNLGGPDQLSSVQEFLFNLFYDKRIITVYNPLRWIIAKSISVFRTKKAQGIYQLIGGKSPLLRETYEQAYSIAKTMQLTNAKGQSNISIKREKIYLNQNDNSLIEPVTIEVDSWKKLMQIYSTTLEYDGPYSITIQPCMRHFFPKIVDLIEYIKNNNTRDIILLPLYPQYSTTTTLSSIENIYQELHKNFFVNELNKLKKTDQDIDNINREKLTIKSLCCYFDNDLFIEAHAKLIEQCNINYQDTLLLFSAHSLPTKMIKNGDPYQWQIEQTVKKITNRLNIKNLNYKISYQSKVGPIEWLQPSTEDEIHLAGKNKQNIVIVPIAFVSDHVETLVELDIEYKEIAAHYQIQYFRVPTLGTNNVFIESLITSIFKMINDDDNKNNSISYAKRHDSKNFSIVHKVYKFDELKCPLKFHKCMCKVLSKI